MKYNNDIEKVVSYLLKASLFDDRDILDDDITSFIIINWSAIKEEARIQEVLPLIAQGASVISGIPKNELRSIIISSTMNNEQSLFDQAEVLNILHNINCAVIKGSSVAIYYPHSEIRTLGDIDILISKKDINKTADILIQNGYIKHDSNHQFHISYNKANAYVELHFGIYKGYDNLAGQTVKNFMEEAVTITYKASLNKYTFPVLDIPHQAVTLLIHMQRHMLATGMGLRQLCDWCMFVNSSLHNIDFCKDILSACGLLKFAKTLTKTCVMYLGLSLEYCQWCVDIDDKICELLFNDICRSGNMGRKENEQRTANKFSAGAERTDKKLNAFSLFISNINWKTRQCFPISNKYKILIPFLAVFIIIRSGIRMITGKRTKVSLSKLYKVTREKNKLYKALGIFKVE